MPVISVFDELDLWCSSMNFCFLEILQGNTLMRILNVAAFAVSGYASTEGRICKPFNPLLGETYEADYPDKGLQFFSEKVCLHKIKLIIYNLYLLFSCHLHSSVPLEKIFIILNTSTLLIEAS